MILKSNRRYFPVRSKIFHFSPRKLAGFTLIELLVVIGLIGALAAGIGLSIPKGTPTSALRAGQGSLAGLLSAARGQAALTQSDAMIVVDVTDAANDDCLRSLQVVVRASTADEWRPVGDPILLPQNVYVVPPDGMSGVPSAGTVEFASGWDAKRKSKGFTSVGTLSERAYNATTYPYQPTKAFDNRRYLKFQVFNSLGTTSAEGTILVTFGRRTEAAKIALENQEVIRGIYVSRYGVATLINEAATFEKVNIP